MPSISGFGKNNQNSKKLKKSKQFANLPPGVSVRSLVKGSGIWVVSFGKTDVITLRPQHVIDNLKTILGGAE